MLSGGQNDGDCASSGRVWIAIDGVVESFVGSDEHTAVSERRRESDAVGSDVEIGELIPAHAIGGRGADRGSAAVVKRDRHTFDTRFIGVLLVVPIKVFPDVVAQGCLFIHVPKVDAGVVFSRCQNDERSAASGGVCITILAVVEGVIDTGQLAPIWEHWRYFDVIAAGLQTPEAVITDAVCGRGADGVIGAVAEGHHDSDDAGLIGVLDSIAV